LAKKEKLFASAQKNLQKGQITRAIKDYQKLVEIDPGEVRHRQKLAELFSRAGSKDKALSEYETVANYYAENGFHLKAIAVCKQIQKLDPGQVKIYYRLAELNEKQGLVGNALSEYRNLVNYFENRKEPDEVVKTLEKMKDLAPDNLNIRVKLAESYAAAGQNDKGLEEFREIQESLRQKGDISKILKLYEIFLPLFPDASEMKTGLAQALIEKGEVEKGIAILRKVLEEHAGHTGALRLLAQGYESLGRGGEQEEALRQLLEDDSSDPDARLGLVRLHLREGRLHSALGELDPWRQALLDDGRCAALQEIYEQLKEALPQDEQVLHSLRAVYEHAGEGNKLFDMISSSSGEPESSAFMEVDLSAGEESCDHPSADLPVDIEALGCKGGIPEDADFSGGSDGEDGSGEVEEIPLEFLEEVAETAATSVVPKPSEEPEEQELEFEIELELDEPATEETSAAGRDVRVEVASETDAPAAVSASGAPSESDEELLLDLAWEEEPEVGPEASPVASAAGSAELEEAEFYLQQGLLEEAEGVCRAILDRDPDNAQACGKLAVIVERLGSEAASLEPPTDGDPLGIFPADDSVGGSGDGDEAFALEETLNELSGPEVSAEEAEDLESHYHLGIAYKEMGLLDEALGEFDKAMKRPERRVDCLTLKGLCLAERSSFEESEGVFREALADKGLSSGQRVSLHYEMGAMYDNWGLTDKALESFQAAAGIDSFFRDVGERVQQLQKTLGVEGPVPESTGQGKGKKDRISYV